MSFFPIGKETISQVLLSSNAYSSLSIVACLPGWETASVKLLGSTILLAMEVTITSTVLLVDKQIG